MKRTILFTAILAMSIANPVPQEDYSSWEEDSNEDGELGYAWEKSGEFEGDILLPPNSDFPRNGLIDDKYRWPNRTLVYRIDDGFDEEQVKALYKAFEEYQTKTCIKMRPKEDEDTDYVLITGIDASGCSSFVGRRGSTQVLNLLRSKPGSGCFRHGTIVHELLHALGFYHQQSASDRDDYVEIVWDNITPGREHNFNKYGESTVTSYNVSYDYESVMHYSAYAFSDNGEKTIVPLKDGVEIGQRVGLSKKDITKLQRMYGCDDKITITGNKDKISSDVTDTDTLESVFLSQ